MTSKARSTNRLALSIGLAALIMAFAAHAAFAFDGRSPDTRDAATGTAVAVMDARSPDTRAIAAPSDASIASDTRDAASRAVPTTPVAAPAPAPGNGFDWGDFGIGLLTGLGGVVAIALLAALALGSRGKRREGTRPATT